MKKNVISQISNLLEFIDMHYSCNSAPLVIRNLRCLSGVLFPIRLQDHMCKKGKIKGENGRIAAQETQTLVWNNEDFCS